MVNSLLGDNIKFKNGDSIAAQLINFFAKYWPELFERELIYKVITPLVVAKKGKQSINFYTSEEFDDWMNKASRSSWNIEYKKGLAALESDEYEDIIKDPKLLKITIDKNSKDTLYDWFGEDSQPRKDKLLNI